MDNLQETNTKNKAEKYKKDTEKANTYRTIWRYGGGLIIGTIVDRSTNPIGLYYDMMELDHENCMFGLEEVLRFNFLQWLVALVK